MSPIGKTRIGIVLLGPSLQAVSGVSTHIKQLFASSLSQDMTLLHFQVGSEGRHESALDKAIRFVTSPLLFLIFLVRHRPAIVHLNTSLEPKSYWRDVAYLFVARMLGRKIIYQVHGGALPQDFFGGNVFLTWLLRQVLTAADAVVLLAQAELSAYREFVPTARLDIIANAIETEGLTSEPLSTKPEYPLHISYVGRLANSKGVSTILEATAKLIREKRDILLTFAGSGPEEAQLKRQSAKLDMVERIRFAGPLFGQEKDNLWRQAHLFAFPTHHEGLPYALLEAMAAGAVPITTRVGAIPDVMQDGLHGIFVNPNDSEGLARAIIRLDDDRAQLNRMAEAGRRRILESYVVTRLAGDFRRLYIELAGDVRKCAA